MSWVNWARPVIVGVLVLGAGALVAEPLVKMEGGTAKPNIVTAARPGPASGRIIRWKVPSSDAPSIAAASSSSSGIASKKPRRSQIVNGSEKAV